MIDRDRKPCMLVAPIYKRWHLSGLTMWKVAVEIGTHRGEFARALLDARYTVGNERMSYEYTLYCVDPWENLPGYEEQAAYLVGGGQNREEDYREAQRVTEPFARAGRCLLLKSTSAIAATKFSDNSVCLGYLDGDHTPKGITNDLYDWWPKIRSGGVLAGHDFICPGADGSWGRFIQPAVLAFAKEVGVDVSIIVEPENGDPWSFYLTKP